MAKKEPKKKEVEKKEKAEAVTTPPVGFDPSLNENKQRHLRT